MQQQMAVVTLGIADPARSRRFYVDGFGWAPVFESAEIIFYQMNGFVLATWLASALAADMRRPGAAAPGPTSGPAGTGAVALAHNVGRRDDVDPVMAALERAGGTILRPADAPPHGGYRGYVADPDGHAWEIAWNPAWPIDPQGHVSFGL
ncbi:VOC family protein [uncultured Paracoccus sp.]|uniref:VOC family protein n=1 Tax=uncultured Paracoccus sp. TaxID=189685 RepID=UPI0026018584|nr:VOC family protein [uncultured Paracoccus sp.]